MKPIKWEGAFNYESSFFSHQDPSMVEWFVDMVEERKSSRTAPKMRKKGKLFINQDKRNRGGNSSDKTKLNTRMG